MHKDRIRKAAGVCIGTAALLAVLILCVMFGVNRNSQRAKEWTEYTRNPSDSRDKTPGGGTDKNGYYTSFTLVNEQTFRAEGIQSIAVLYSMEDVEIIISSSQDIVLKEYMKVNPTQEEKAEITQTGGTLEIRSGKRPAGRRIPNGLFGSTSPWGYTEIYLPETYAGELEIETTSGDISSQKVLTLSKLELRSTSGDMWLDKVTADTVWAEATSGNLEFRSLTGTAELSTTSGDIRLEEGEGELGATATSGDMEILAYQGPIRAMATSGEIQIEDSKGCLDAQTTSGGVYLNLLELNGDLDIRTTSADVDVTVERFSGKADIKASTKSGEITLRIPESTALTFQAETGSGEIIAFFDEELSFDKSGSSAEGTIGDNPAVNMRLETFSGDIYVDNY